MQIKTQNGFKFGTKVSDIIVPDIFRRKIKSCIDYFDSVFGGGLTPSSVILFTGSPGSGKTTMMLTLANALAKMGALVIFNTCEESLYQVKMKSETLGLRNGFLLAEEQNVPTLLHNCDVIRTKSPFVPFILIVDSIQTVNDGKFDAKSPLRSLELITDWCKANNTVAIVIGQVTKGGTHAGANTLKHLVDAHLQLSIDQNSKSETRGLRVLAMSKNRFTGMNGNPTWYLDLNEKGFKSIAVDGDD